MYSAVAAEKKFIRAARTVFQILKLFLILEEGGGGGGRASVYIVYFWTQSSTHCMRAAGSRVFRRITSYDATTILLLNVVGAMRLRRGESISPARLKADSPRRRHHAPNQHDESLTLRLVGKRRNELGARVELLQRVVHLGHCVRALAVAAATLGARLVVGLVEQVVRKRKALQHVVETWSLKFVVAGLVLLLILIKCACSCVPGR